MKRVIFYILMLSFCSTGLLIAQEYQIGPEDVLSIQFWQQPELNTNVRVSQNGTIILPVIGSLTAAGLTPTELATKIVDRISIFNEKISQASVIVAQYESKKVYLTGQVMLPGKYVFETIPSLWKIILEAGGPTENADLSQVKIIRGVTERGETATVDLSKYLKYGETSILPPIYPGDTINIPAIASRETETTDVDIPAETLPGSPTATTSSAPEAKKVIYLYGQVAHPGGYPFNKQLDLLEAIILAGGPTPVANLAEVKIIIRGKPYSSVATVNLETYAKNGTPAPFSLKAGDTIYIPRKKTSILWELFQQGGIMYDVLRLVVTAMTSYFLYSALAAE